MKKLKYSYILLFLTITVSFYGYAQSRLIINNGGYVVMNGGTSSSPLYLVIENSNPNAITRNTSGYIISESEFNKIQWNVGTTIGTYTFPLGKSTTAYVPFVFDKTTAGTPSGTGMVRVSSWFTTNNATWPSSTSLCGTTEDNVTDRFWLIDVLNYSANPTATVDFYYNTGEIQTISETELQMQRWNSSLASSCKWETPPVGTVNTTNKYVRVSTLSDFSPWAMIRQSAPLPIELLYFKARWKDQQYTTVILEWQTAAEINNDYFEIQRSADAVNFETIGTTQGAGNSSTIINYDFSDAEFPIPNSQFPTLYYRLRQVDYDGSYSYSNIEALNVPSGINLITVYPNPSSDHIDYLVYSSEDAEVSVLTMDAAGKIIISEKHEVKKGANKFRTSTSHLSSGNYVLEIIKGINKKTEKQFIISK